MRPTRLFFGTILIIALLAFGVTAFAQYDPNDELPRPTNPTSAVADDDGYLVVFTDNLFMRTGDRAIYTPVAILDGGTYLVVLGNNGLAGDRLWWYVQAGSLRGWVKDEFVVVRGDLSGTPTVEPEGVVIPPTLYIGYSAPVYNNLTPSGEIVCRTLPGQWFTVTAQNASSATWYQIRVICGGRVIEGWVWSEYGFLRNPAEVDIPIES